MIAKEQIDTINSLAELAHAVEIQHKILDSLLGNNTTHIYPDESLGYRLTPEGIRLFDVESPGMWGESYDQVDSLVPWEEITPENLARLKKDVANAKRRRDRELEQRRREQYERMKAEFEK